jgi:hypothetical protein
MMVLLGVEVTCGADDLWRTGRDSNPRIRGFADLRVDLFATGAGGVIVSEHWQLVSIKS